MTSSHARLARRRQHPLDVLFAPESVAIFGATNKPGSVGRTVMANLIRDPFGGWILPINPGQPSAHGIEAYPNLAAVPTAVELAIVATPAPTVPAILDECRAAGVKAALVLSGGFGESGPTGAELGRQLRDGLSRGPLRVVGPNSIGIACPSTSFNATFAPAMVPAGKVGFLSQSGALLTALLEQNGPAGVGCSAFISVGSLLDIGWVEWLTYLARDPQTECIGIYMEQVGDAPSFFAAARAVALQKPIILLKGGKHAAHGPVQEVFEEACRCSGIVRVDRFADLLRMAEHLTTRPRTRGRRLAIVSNARGPALLAGDALHACGGSLAALAPETIQALQELLPSHWPCQNPIDVGDDADASRFARAAALAVRDPHADALLVLLTPQAAIDPLLAAQEVAAVAQASDKPVLACWLWGAADQTSLRALRDAGIPTFHSPETAIRTFSNLWRHREACLCLETTQATQSETATPAALTSAASEEIADFDRVEAVRMACHAGQTVLTDKQMNELLSAYGLPVDQKIMVSDESEAFRAADALGYPVVLEWHLDPHAAPLAPDHELIRLRAADAAVLGQALRVTMRVANDAFGHGKPGQATIRPSLPSAVLELTASLTTDAEYGTVLRLGERNPRPTPPAHWVTALAPLTVDIAHQLVERCLAPQILGADNADRMDLAELERFLIRLSRLGAEQPWIKEVTIGSLLVWPGRVLARNLRAVLDEPANSKPEISGQRLTASLAR